MKNIAVLTLICGIILAACAVREPPSGGPEDKEPPGLLESRPAADSSGLPADMEITLVFDEKIDGESFRNRVTFYPELPFDEIGADNSELNISFSRELPETTISLFLRRGYKDYHGVESDRNLVMYYSTDDSFPPGSVSGTVTFKDEVTEMGIARLTSLEPDTLDYKSRKELRTVPADRDGNFTFRYLPTDSTAILVWAFIDKNEDGEYSETSEFSSIHPDTVYLTGRRSSRTGLLINVIDPNEPGIISGEVANETGIDIPPSILIEPVDRDRKKSYSLADSTGKYEVMGIRPGGYTISAFLDICADSIRSTCADPFDSTRTIQEPGINLPDTLYLEPGERKLIDLIIITGEGEKQ